MSVFVDCIIMQKTASPDSRHYHQNKSDTALEQWQITGLVKEGLMIKQGCSPFTSAIDLINNCPDLFENSFEKMLQTLQATFDSNPVEKLEVENKPLAFVVAENSSAISKMLKDKTCADNLLVLNLYTRIYGCRIKVFHLSDRVVRSSKMGPNWKQHCVRLLLHQNLLFLLEKKENNFDLDQNGIRNNIDAKPSLLDQTKSTNEDSIKKSPKKSVRINPIPDRYFADGHSNITILSSKAHGQNGSVLPSDFNGTNSTDKMQSSISNSHRSAPEKGYEHKSGSSSPVIGKLVFYSLSKNFGGLSTEAKEMVFVSKNELQKAGINVDDPEFAQRLTKEDIIISCRKETLVEKGNQHLIGRDLKLVNRLHANNQF